MSAAFSVALPRHLSSARTTEVSAPAPREERPTARGTRPTLERSTRVSSIAEALSRWLDQQL